MLEAMIKEIGHNLGFLRVGIAPARSFEEHQALRDWLAQGRHGQMGYLEQSAEKRMDPLKVMPEARSIMTCTLLYNTVLPKSTECNEPDRGWIARYAWGEDYHEVFLAKLRQFESEIGKIAAKAFSCRSYVDTGPTMDRVLAKQAGLGWIGKNTCLIHPKDGSYTFIGVILTNLTLTPDPVIPDYCGSCTACIDACPTRAITAPYELDARKCISYLTIEYKGDFSPSAPSDEGKKISDEVKKVGDGGRVLGMGDGATPNLGNHLFGCDICQDVCPWNRRAPVTEDMHFQPKNGFFNPKLTDFESKLGDYPIGFSKSPLKRAKKVGLMRNVRRIPSRTPQ